MKFAVIENNIVVNLIDAPSLEVAQAVAGNNVVETTQENAAHIGLGYDGTAFEQPPVEEV